MYTRSFKREALAGLAQSDDEKEVLVMQLTQSVDALDMYVASSIDDGRRGTYSTRTDADAVRMIQSFAVAFLLRNRSKLKNAVLLMCDMLPEAVCDCPMHAASCPLTACCPQLLLLLLLLLLPAVAVC